MKDKCNNSRSNYLRLSVTDKCNLNCVYCLPHDRVKLLSHDKVLRYEEMVKAVSLMARLGIRNVRITGGEPLIKRNLVFLVEELKKVKYLEEVSMTTNGILLYEHALELKRAGLDRVNISLDTLKKDKYAQITGEDSFEKVWRSVIRALEVGLQPVKINVVLFENVNDDEVLDFAELTMKYDINVRFIEYMEVTSVERGLKSLPNSEILKVIKNKFDVKEFQNAVRGNGPSRNYCIENAKGTIGFISSNTACFCDCCNRLRMSCDGKLYPCLFSNHHLNVKELIRFEKSDEAIMSAISDLMQNKYKYTRDGRHFMNCVEKMSADNHNVEMCYIGG